MTTLSTFGQILQQQLFPVLEQELGPLSERYAALVKALALLQLDGFVAVRHGRGRPAHDRACVARAFLAKAICNLPHTRALIERLTYDVTLRRLCGWERAAEVPEESTFSRVFGELATQEFGQRVHAAVIARTQSERLVGHVLRDSTAIPAREKPEPKPKTEEALVKRPHRRSGTTQQPERMTRIERQCAGMSLEEMVKELPTACNVGCKPNAHGHKEYWPGYKLHLDVIDGQIPISYMLTSASVNDNQVAVPLAVMTAQRITSCYDVMDAGYDCEAIREHSRKLGHVPIIRPQKRGTLNVEMAPHEKARYRERTGIERAFSRLKDEFGFSTLRVRGARKVLAHLMFGILALTADQILRWCGTEEGLAPAPS
ncbi:MAG: transposase [Candidatus Sulfotelmatobacter sp.]